MKRFKDILCVVVPDSEDRYALQRAADLARNNQARLTVIEVIDAIPSNIQLPNAAPSPDELQKKIITDNQQKLDELVTPWRNKLEIQTRVLIGIPYLEIIREVLRHGHDLVIKTAERGGLLDRLFGSDDMHLLRKCPCPVWLVKSKSVETYQRILAAVDVDDYYPAEELKTRNLLNVQILEMACSLALSESAELHIVNAWEAMAESAMRGAIMRRPEHEIVSYVEQVKQQHKQNLKVLVEEVSTKLGKNALDYLKPQTHLLKGSPRKEVPAFAQEMNADLVIMGTVARTGISGFFMGNTAEAILNQLNCSVLAIKPPGFKTPVKLAG